MIIKILLLLLFFIITLYSKEFYRDGSLQDLLLLFNESTYHSVIKSNDRHINNEDIFYDFLNLFTSWVIAPPKEDLIITERPRLLNNNTLKCDKRQYSQVFTGNLLSGPRLIIDLVPFGYDIDTLEIRLYELYDIVDIFIIYEAPKTQSAHRKPLYYSMIKDTPRFARFKEKILYFAADEKSLESLAHRTKHSRTSGPNWFKERFALELSMRSEPIRLFQELEASNSFKKTVLEQLSLSNAWILQNDGDELPSAEAVIHFKYCELKSDRIAEVFLPSFPFKKNYYWIQETKDLDCMVGGNIDGSNSYLKFHIWRPGPYIQILSDVLREGATRRHRKANSITPCKHHLGFGAATHLSSIAEPIGYLLKRYSVIEQDHRGSLTNNILMAWKNNEMTSALLMKETLFPWCETKHVTNMSTIEGQDLIYRSIPWIVRYNPWRYPFMLPTNRLSYLMADLEEMKVSNIIPSEVISRWHRKVNEAKRMPSPHGDLVIFESAGTFAECSYPNWKEYNECTLSY